ncbi:MAG: DUF2239 family protein [Caulobacter sp.]|nr:DUF2239 family protein [Caulobacter sp.]
MIRTYTAFLRDRRLASGSMADVLLAMQAQPGARAALVFDDSTGEQVKLGRTEEVRRALEVPAVDRVAPKGPATMQVALLPRHVAWLEAQPGGPSAAVRRLVEAARREGVGRDRQARDAAYRFMSMVAGDLPGFEEACRALYAGDAARFINAAEPWPGDVRAYARRLAGEGLGQGSDSEVMARPLSPLG